MSISSHTEHSCISSVQTTVKMRVVKTVLILKKLLLHWRWQTHKPNIKNDMLSAVTEKYKSIIEVPRITWTLHLKIVVSCTTKKLYFYLTNSLVLGNWFIVITYTHNLKEKKGIFYKSQYIYKLNLLEIKHYVLIC